MIFTKHSVMKGRTGEMAKALKDKKRNNIRENTRMMKEWSDKRQKGGRMKEEIIKNL